MAGESGHQNQGLPRYKYIYIGTYSYLHIYPRKVSNPIYVQHKLQVDNSTKNQIGMPRFLKKMVLGG